ncbi:MAG TPA: ABC transporter permease [Actinophytocola sp.]|uniref:ABC transporter permease n=1 Tax=Actinophytocola sp. TaxID=1872138 RepID=UPI002DBE9024|nr:ABC transporter permease [Actinophytocola sp.]HEU5470826.1 ABC transporter permease [Actinophytocola sp.]
MTAFIGTWSLVRLALRRDRILLPAWILVFAAFAYSSAAASVGLYPTVESRVALATGSNANPSLLALYGWIFDPTSLGAISLYKLIALGAAMVAVLTIIVTVRHTRAEEETGRLELIGSTVVGRYAPLTAALIVSFGASLVLGVLSALGLMSPGLPASGAFAFGLAWAATGIVFAAVAAVAAQLTSGARTATGIATAVLGAAYLIRAIGDSTGDGGPSWFSWLSPLGWTAQVRPFAGDRWWVLLIPLLFALACSAGAFALVARRDMGAGLLPDRPGPARGAAGLASPLALAWRLQRGALLGWTVGFVVAGLVFGGIAANVGSLADSEQAREMITKLGGQQGLTDAFMATEMGFLAMIVAAFGIQAALRLRAEETALRAEPVLATSVSRTRWALSHLGIALGGSAALLLTAGLAAGLSYGATTDLDQFGRVFGAALAQLPAACVLTGIAFAAFGLVPQYSVAGWAALSAFVLIGLIGPIVGLDQWVMDVSPFTHTPKLPGTEFSAVPLVWLALVTVAGVAAGFAGLRRRDIG